MTEMDIQSFFYLIKKSSEDLGICILIKDIRFWSMNKMKNSKSS